MQEEIISKQKIDKTCDFCIELHNFKRSEFAQIYGDKRRIILSNNHFCVMPTIGQLFQGSLLIFPKEHFCSFAEIPREIRAHLEKMIQFLEEKLTKFGKTVLFEHGTTPEIGGGCGIYHAHIHLVPLPSNVPSDYILNSNFYSFQNIEDALLFSEQSGEYLLYRDIKGDYYVSSPSTRLESQYFRKKIHKFFDLQTPWDWRKYKFEKKLVGTINYFNQLDRDLFKEY